jgi:hypothetical protein
MKLMFWRKRKTDEEAKFLRLVMRTVSYGRELDFKPPRKRDDEEHADRTLRSLLKMVKQK